MLPTPPSHHNMPPPPSSSSSSSSSSPSLLKPRRHQHHRPSTCEHSSTSATTIDLLILMLVLFACAFLVFSSFSHILRSISLVLPPLLAPLLHSFHDSPLPYIAGLIAFIAATAAAAAIAWAGVGGVARRCRNPMCRGLKDAVEFDVKVQTEEWMRSPPDQLWKEIESLPWKGGGKGDNPDYECVRKELRRMAPSNGRAVLLFRARCGCPLSKLEGWGPKKGRRPKKSMEP